jgi:hypothetical protein
MPLSVTYWLLEHNPLCREWNKYYQSDPTIVTPSDISLLRATRAAQVEFVTFGLLAGLATRAILRRRYPGPTSAERANRQLWPSLGPVTGVLLALTEQKDFFDDTGARARLRVADYARENLRLRGKITGGEHAIGERAYVSKVIWEIREIEAGKMAESEATSSPGDRGWAPGALEDELKWLASDRARKAGFG